MSNTTGQLIEGIEHLRQSIRDILTTRKGSRVLNRNYGSDLYLWIDAPLDRSTEVRIYEAVAKALDQWEPRFELHQVRVEKRQAGQLSLALTGRFLMDSRPIVQIDRIEVQ